MWSGWEKRGNQNNFWKQDLKEEDQEEDQERDEDGIERLGEGRETA
jgi:hypothetical protein